MPDRRPPTRDLHFDGAALRAARKAHGYTVAKLSQLTGVSPSYIKYVEAGRNQPSLLYARALAAGVGRTVDELSTPTGGAVKSGDAA